MTAQAHEILILEGSKTSMAFCPPLPENDSRITKAPQTTINSSCWRGYVGSWEIKHGRFFLIGLSGKYKLRDETPLFAEWFSGEIKVPQGDILNYVHGGSTPIYEREQHITVENGIVVASSTVDNCPPPLEFTAGVRLKEESITEYTKYPEAAKIQNFVEKRGIESLLHFTKVANVPGILAHGLLGRATLSRRGLDVQVNDQHRYDRVPDAVCASIGFPNYKMFYGLQQSNADVDWAVLRINPRVLWEIPCAYCISNAASNDVTRVPLEDRMSVAALESMFEDVPPDIQRVHLGIPNDYTTNPQAEVLILGAVDPSYIIDVNVNAKDRIKNMITVQQLFKPYSDKFKFRHDGSLFTYRKDYEHWQRTQGSSRDLGIDLDELFDF